MQDSNLQPPQCKCDALPIELIVRVWVRGTGVEPACFFKAYPPQGYASANFATRARNLKLQIL